tara:strand:+ start:185 stop:433 length:249 start_codon:yes stop_codon:yes gene_type:complete
MRARNLFTDLSAAIEEADYLAELHQKKFIIVQQLGGEMWVTKANGRSCHTMYQTCQPAVARRWEWVADIKPLSLAYSHRNPS